MLQECSVISGKGKRTNEGRKHPLKFLALGVQQELQQQTNVLQVTLMKKERAK